MFVLLGDALHPSFHLISCLSKGTRTLSYGERIHTGHLQMQTKSKPLTLLRWWSCQFLLINMKYWIILWYNNLPHPSIKTFSFFSPNINPRKIFKGNWFRWILINTFFLKVSVVHFGGKNPPKNVKTLKVFCFLCCASVAFFHFNFICHV